MTRAPHLLLRAVLGRNFARLSEDDLRDFSILDVALQSLGHPIKSNKHAYTYKYLTVTRGLECVCARVRVCQVTSPLTIS